MRRVNKPDIADFGLPPGSVERIKEEISRRTSITAISDFVGDVFGFIVGVFIYSGVIFMFSAILAFAPILCINLFGRIILQWNSSSYLSFKPIYILIVFVVILLLIIIYGIKLLMGKIQERNLAKSKPPIATQSELDKYEIYKKAVLAWSSKQWETWAKMDGHAFEHKFTCILNQNGWNMRATKGSGDGGVDIAGNDNSGSKFVIQCKWWSKPCGEAPVRDLAGVLAVRGHDAKGIIVCKSGFTKSATCFAADAGITLWDGEKVMEWVDPDIPNTVVAEKAVEKILKSRGLSRIK